jgi:hypothetical protein
MSIDPRPATTIVGNLCNEYYNTMVYSTQLIRLINEVDTTPFTELDCYTEYDDNIDDLINTIKSRM